MGFHVDSETGRLRRVILHRPDLELKRLTPSNKDMLLFDDVLWVRRAREEHDGFADVLRDRGSRSISSVTCCASPSTSRRHGRSSWTASSTRRSTVRSPPIICARSSTRCRRTISRRRWSAG